MSEPDRGLDLAHPGTTTEQEKADFQSLCAANLGRTQPGFDFWLEQGPEVLKRYRAFATAGQKDRLPGDTPFAGFGFLQYYALLGYSEGVRYLVRLWQLQHLNKTQVLEGLALGFIHMGPRGMETVAEALEDYEWLVPDQAARFPEGWARDPSAIRSGLDFGTREMTLPEAKSLRAWYLGTLGEVPRYVEYQLKYNPAALKTFRARYETAIETLPKQVIPYTMLHWNVLRGFGDGIRENVLLARGFGMSRDLTLRAIYSALINAGVETASLVDRAAGQVFDEWDWR